MYRVVPNTKREGIAATDIYIDTCAERMQMYTVIRHTIEPSPTSSHHQNK